MKVKVASHGFVQVVEATPEEWDVWYHITPNAPIGSCLSHIVHVGKAHGLVIQVVEVE